MPHTHKRLLVALLALAGLLTLAAPLPVMLGEVNDTTEAAFAVVYGAVTLGWVGASVWALLSWPRLPEIINAHPWDAALLAVPAVVGVFGLRLATLFGVIGVPTALEGPLVTVPALMLAIALLLLGALLTPEARSAAAVRLPTLDARWGLVALGAAGLALLAIALMGDYWQFPLTADPSAHLYLGQHVLRGDLPYRDLIYFHPPLRFALSTVWNGTAALLSLSPVGVARLWDVLAALALVGCVGALGWRVSRSWVGGGAAAIVLVGSEALSLTLIPGPTFRITIMALLAGGLLALTWRRWLLAGVLFAAAVTMYLPAGIGVLVGVFAALTQKDDPRGSALLRLVGGGAAVVAPIMLMMLARGTLVPALRQSFGALWLLPGSGANVVTGGRFASWFDATSFLLLGEWESLVLIGVGVVLLLTEGRSWLNEPRLFAPLSAALLAFAVYAIEGGLSTRDLLFFIVPGSVIAGAGLVRLIEGITSHEKHAAVGLAALAMLTALAFADYLPQNRARFAEATLTLAEQQTAAEALAAALDEDDTVQAINALWFHVLSHEPLPTRFMQTGAYSTLSAQAEGATLARINAEIQAEAPAVVIIARPGTQDLSWLAEDYALAVTVKPFTLEQMIYVREDRPQILALFDAMGEDRD